MTTVHVILAVYLHIIIIVETIDLYIKSIKFNISGLDGNLRAPYNVRVYYYNIAHGSHLNHHTRHQHPPAHPPQQNLRQTHLTKGHTSGRVVQAQTWRRHHRNRQ